jgi:hypothetical protein
MANYIDKKIVRVRGDTYGFGIQKKLNGVLQDLNGYTFTFTAKIKSSDTDLQAVFQKTFNVTTSTTTLAFVIESTEFNDLGTYYYDIQEKNLAGDITTIFLSSWSNIDDITKTT